MPWIYLLLAGLMEIAWMLGLKYSDGFTRLVPAIATVIALTLSMFLLSIAIKTIPLGTAYAIWTGTGAVGAAVMGILLFNEPASVLRLLAIVAIVLGIVGLKLTASTA